MLGKAAGAVGVGVDIAQDFGEGGVRVLRGVSVDIAQDLSKGGVWVLLAEAIVFRPGWSEVDLWVIVVPEAVVSRGLLSTQRKCISKGRILTCQENLQFRKRVGNVCSSTLQDRFGRRLS